MPRELIVLSVGQCGLQLGSNFWQLALEEHANYNRNNINNNNNNNNNNYIPTFDDSMSSFFRNIDLKSGENLSTNTNIQTLRARAILIDMECGVLDELLSSKSEFSTLFDRSLSVSSVSGSGNNFSQGYYEYGPKYKEIVLNKLYKTIEDCDSLQAFLLIHSLGGGTGSGLGSYIISLLSDNFPDILRFVNSVYPSPISDVITSPYNSLFATNTLIEHADAVLTVDNQALTKLSNIIYNNNNRSNSTHNNNNNNNNNLFTSSKKSGFSDMNLICGELLCGLTASMRFPGQLNTDLNEITMNLVPYPNLHFLMPSISPLVPLSNSNNNNNNNSIAVDSLFSTLLHPDSQLLSFNNYNYRSEIYMSFGLLCRGNIGISDINRGVKLIKQSIHMPIWNSDGFKLGLCSVPSARKISTVLGLANSSNMNQIFSSLYDRFNILYKRKAHLHHYTEFMEESEIIQAIDNVRQIQQDYKNIQINTMQNSKENKSDNFNNNNRYIPAI